MDPEYDAIVVGARCAGSPTAMLLARAGHRVLLVDRATFPSDTLSTHAVHAPGVAALRRWGLLDTVIATGCPPLETYSFDFGQFTIAGTPRPWDGGSVGYAPRRFLLDKILLDAAAAAGVEVREHFSVDDVLVEDGVVVGIHGHDANGTPTALRARVVVGADGRSSRVARAVQAEQYLEKPRLQFAYYTYWRDLPVDGFTTVIRPDRGWGAFPTNDGLTLLVVGWPYAEAAAYKADIEANYLRTLELAPEFAARVRAATRVEPFAGGRCPTSCASPTGRAGHWSATPGTRRTRSPPRGCPMPSATPSCAPRPWTTTSAALTFRRRDVGLSAHPGRPGATHLRVHDPAGDSRAPAAGGGATAVRRGRRPGGDGHVRRRRRREPCGPWSSSSPGGRILGAASVVSGSGQ